MINNTNDYIVAVGTTGSDPICRRTPPEAKTAQVVDATLCARVIVGKR